MDILELKMTLTFPLVCVIVLVVSARVIPESRKSLPARIDYQHKDQLKEVVMQILVCSYCKSPKPQSEFYRCRTIARGFQYECRKCRARYNAVPAHRNHRREWQREWKKKNPERVSWSHMRRRCNNPNHESYNRYGGRGITICERWDTFKNFLADMGPKPTPKHGIDRIDNDGNYEPGNCRWATIRENVRNRSTTKLSPSKVMSIVWHRDFAGMTLKDISEAFGVSRRVIAAIINGRLWADVSGIVAKERKVR